MKTASQLSSNDLERVAVMKRCGLFDPTTMMAAPLSNGSSSSASELQAAAVAVPQPVQGEPRQELVKEVTDARGVVEANGEDGVDSQED
jgi:hypothetical protein